MFGNSRSIVSNQTGIHKDLPAVIHKHQQHTFARPISGPVRASFDRLDDKVRHDGRPVILDSGCGVGESTHYLAMQHPENLVIGIDKSGHRLEKSNTDLYHPPENTIFQQANLIDFWRLIQQAGWHIEKHYILYPNPWPLKKDLKKRFHAHPVFPVLLLLCPFLELRSNWSIYLQEFATATELVTGQTSSVVTFQPDPVMTPFERKYLASGQQLYRLVIDLAK